MKAISAQLVSRLKLSEAIQEEAATERNMLPREVNWANISENSGRLVKSITSQIRAGFKPAPQEITSVRKLHGTRPVAVWGVIERIVYRALTKMAVGDDFVFDRSGNAYLKFVNGPISYAATKRRPATNDSALNLFFLNDSEIEYVVSADIAAFYQYVDHNILARELRMRGGDFDAIEHLIELLQEVQGRTFGIPQLLDSSDFLSEVYIERVERDLIRHGLPVWRYNDDFRIACRSYSEALQSIEKLDASARSVGLVTSEYKTLTHGFVKYVFDNVGLVEHERQGAVDLDEIETAISEYVEDFSEDPESARLIVQRTATGQEGEGVKLRSIDSDGMRTLRRAIGSLAVAGDSTVVKDVGEILPYIPAITPTVCRYLTAAYKDAPEEVAKVVDSATDLSMNEWQSQWFLQLMQDLDLLKAPHANLHRRVSWVGRLRFESSSSTTVAYATRTLAGAGCLTSSDVVDGFDSAPDVLKPWYVESLMSCCQVEGERGDEAKKRLAAFKSSSPLYASIVGRTADV